MLGKRKLNLFNYSKRQINILNTHVSCPFPLPAPTWDNSNTDSINFIIDITGTRVLLNACFLHR